MLSHATSKMRDAFALGNEKRKQLGSHLILPEWRKEVIPEHSQMLSVSARWRIDPARQTAGNQTGKNSAHPPGKPFDYGFFLRKLTRTALLVARDSRQRRPDPTQAPAHTLNR